jgi:hypothetical protein
MRGIQGGEFGIERLVNTLIARNGEGPSKFCG